MSWKCYCPDDHEDSEKICPICGMKVFLVLILSGAIGTRKFSGGSKPVQMGRFVYESIAGDDAQFVAAIQYNLAKGDDGEWYLTAVSRTMHATTLNDSLCEPSVPVKLQDGDVIKIAARNDLTKSFAHLSVSIERRFL